MSDLSHVRSSLENIRDPSEHSERESLSITTDLLSRFPDPTIVLTNASFVNGTFRIRTPGHYQLGEDIDFDPPTLERPSRIYPFPPYQLGFFAAITVECDNVILDLNGYTLQQSEKHALRQRFYSNIELSSQPFNAGAGPSVFGAGVRSANNCYIKGGYLGRSSHHGIHSAGTPTNVVIQDVSIFDFEVAGIHLNGAKNAHLERLHIGPNRTDCPVLHTFSHGIFALPRVKELKDRANQEQWRARTPGYIHQKLKHRLDAVEEDVLQGRKVADALFANPSGLPDGNVYGIVIHGKGVVVNDFKEKINEDRAENISLCEVCIEGLVSKPLTLKSMLLTNQDGESYGAAGRVHTGPVGDVINFDTIVDPSTKKYVPNVLSEAQFLCAKYHVGTARCSDMVLNWAENDTVSYAQIEAQYDYDCIRDAMHHVMKGSFGIFITNAQIVRVVNAVLCDFENQGEDPYDPLCSYRGHHQTGILVNAGEQISLIHCVANHLSTTAGRVCGIETNGKSVVYSENVQISRLSPHGNRCTMMKSDGEVRHGPGHQPVRLK